jgi:hypothetical protein
VLAQENIDEMDMFLALTNDDEDNIMAASLAKRLGCKRVLALINRRAYADMVQGGPIDIGLSPAQVSIGSLLAFVRHGDVAGCTACAAARRGAGTGRAWRPQQFQGGRPPHRGAAGDPGAHIGAILRKAPPKTMVQMDGFPDHKFRVDHIVIPTTTR